MQTLFAPAMRRFASTIFVFFALFVACVGVNAAPSASGLAAAEASQEHAAQHALAVADDTASFDDQDPVPSLEDNSGGLDDTFDVPPQHVVTIPHVSTSRHADVRPAPHAHHPSLELRPPIV
ncbi:MAG: hypothetical protein AAGC76_06515 [Luteibacter sp.]|jgi:hypothetical protein|uniref:hypothetical protein n=1 Tax=Luteibacter sp. TaxID=1886636 RepID=UPI0028089007|nr:hypothetical protein [Luteibacter sp.]MDQ7995487.1 hypothetical protein [Luteibacter sp.]MDQ8048904.1 hypothetical protein [Luteibacter sp.]